MLDPLARRLLTLWFRRGIEYRLPLSMIAEVCAPQPLDGGRIFPVRPLRVRNARCEERQAKAVRCGFVGPAAEYKYSSAINLVINYRADRKRAEALDRQLAAEHARLIEEIEKLFIGGPAPYYMKG